MILNFNHPVDINLDPGELHDGSDAAGHLVHVSPGRWHERQLCPLVKVQLECAEQLPGRLASPGYGVPVEFSHLVLTP